MHKAKCGVLDGVRLRLHERTYRCASCGNVADRDFNAALNLRNYGLNCPPVHPQTAGHLAGSHN